MATISVANAHLWVHDQDEALEFWTEKVGFEVRQDITMAELDTPSIQSGQEGKKPSRVRKVTLTAA